MQELITYLEQHEGDIAYKMAKSIVDGQKANIGVVEQDILLESIFKTFDSKLHVFIPPNFKFHLIYECELGKYFNNQYFERLNDVNDEYLNFYLFKYLKSDKNEMTSGIYDYLGIGGLSFIENHFHDDGFLFQLSSFCHKIQGSLFNKFAIPSPYDRDDKKIEASLGIIAIRLDLLNSLEKPLMCINNENKTNELKNFLSVFNDDFELAMSGKLQDDLNKKIGDRFYQSQCKKIGDFLQNCPDVVMEMIIDNLSNENHILKMLSVDNVKSFGIDRGLFSINENTQNVIKIKSFGV